jgi:hypothetical protein
MKRNEYIRCACVVSVFALFIFGISLTDDWQNAQFEKKLFGEINLHKTFHKIKEDAMRSAENAMRSAVVCSSIAEREFSLGNYEVAAPEYMQGFVLMFGTTKKLDLIDYLNWGISLMYIGEYEASQAVLGSGNMWAQLSQDEQAQASFQAYMAKNADYLGDSGLAKHHRNNAQTLDPCLVFD